MEYPVTTEETKNFYGFTVGYAFMSMVDLVQTLYGVNNGFEEGNPMVKPFASNNISLSVIKILGTLGVCWKGLGLKHAIGLELILTYVM